jgi:uncharacterized membrane protein YqjE
MSEQTSSGADRYGHSWQSADRTSFGDLIQDIVSNIQSLIRSEFKLARSEIKEDASAAGRAIAVLMAGLAFGFYALGFLLLAAVYALGLVLAAWLSALIIGAAVLVFAAMLAGIGYGMLKQINPKPERTVDTVKEDVAWVKREVSHGK